MLVPKRCIQSHLTLPNKDFPLPYSKIKWKNHLLCPSTRITFDLPPNGSDGGSKEAKSHSNKKAWIFCVRSTASLLGTFGLTRALRVRLLCLVALALNLARTEDVGVSLSSFPTNYYLVLSNHTISLLEFPDRELKFYTWG